MPTPVKVRGKPGNKKSILSSKATKSKATSNMQQLSTRTLSKLEVLPTELIQLILWQSTNLNLTSVSPTLASKLNNNSLRRRFVFLAFFEYSVNYGHEYLNFYHELYGVHFDYSEKFHLINQIIDQAWFSTKLFFSCQKELLARILPKPLFDLLGTQHKAATKSSTVLRQNLHKQFPRKIIDLLGTHEPDKIPNTDDFFKLPDTGDGEQWYSYDGGRFFIAHSTWPVTGGLDRIVQFYWTVKEWDGSEFEITVAAMKFIDDPELNLRLFNPRTWTDDDLALLLILTLDFNPHEPSDEIMDAASSGIMTAISQGFVPAVFLRCSLMRHERNTKLTNDNLEALVRQIKEHAQERTVQGDISTSTSWILSWAPHSTHGREDKSMSWEKMLTSEHLVKAMDMMCKPDINISRYYIFCWIVINLIIKITNENLQLKDDIFKQLYEDAFDQVNNLALTANTEYSLKSRKFFNDTMYGVLSWKALELNSEESELEEVDEEEIEE